MKKLLLIGCLFTCFAATTFAQDEEEPAKKGFDKNKLFLGGNFGLGFGSVSTLINVSPQIGYRFNRYFAAGTGVNFIYSSYNYQYITGENYKESYGVTGLNIFGRVYPIDFLFLQVQPELNYTWGKDKFADNTTYKLDSKFVPSLLAAVARLFLPAADRL